MTCFPCAVVKREVELRLAEEGASAAEIVAGASAALCLMCAAEQQQSQRPAAPE